MRALAVIPVILFHAGFDGFRGGFIGVDVFFVISGYLITTQILNDKKAGRFTIAGFYERRARRILPALFFVMMASLLPAWLWMLPDQIQAFSQSLIAVSAFVSNIYFRNTGGYFDALAAEKPLLHTWSLGVEEQYYVVFPIVVVLCWRLGRKRLAWTCRRRRHGIVRSQRVVVAPRSGRQFLSGSSKGVGIAAGLPRCVCIVRHAPASTSRAVARRSPRGARIDADCRFRLSLQRIDAVSECLRPAGDAWHSPGDRFASGTTRVARLLSLKWLVGIGLISYSAYLWHQPLFAFARILTLNQVEKHVMAMLALLSLPLAFLTWRFVEVPLRRKSFFSRKVLFRACAVLSLTFITAGTLGNSYAPSGDRAYLKRVNCGLSCECEFATDFTPVPACITAIDPKFVVWGDSYAMHLVPAIVASDPAIALAQATRSVCGPLIDVGPFISAASLYNRSWAEECIRFNRSVISYVEEKKSVEVVVLSSPFGQYLGEGGYTMLTPRGVKPPSLEFAIERMKATIDALRQARKRVVLVAPLPRADYNMGDCAERLLLGKPVLGPIDACRFNREAYMERHKEVMSFLEQMEKDDYVKVFRFDGFLCDNERCASTKDGVAIYRDGEHLSYRGAEYLGRSMGLADRLDRMAK